MKRKRIRAYTGFVLLALAGVYACDRDEVFEKEQYKNVFALISGSDNVSPRYHKLGTESVGYVAASCGGTNPTRQDIVVNLTEDASLIDDYNKANFDVNVSKYARPLPKNKYDIDSYQFTIAAGAIGGRLPVRIRPDGLSPDSTYFIALRVDSHTTSELNPEKSYLLYSVRIRNYWAKGDGATIYSMRGKLMVQGEAAELEMPGTKVMQPLSRNSVRVMAGNETWEADIAVINKGAIILEIGEDNRVTISSYEDMEVQQIDGDADFPNVFRIEDDGFKTYKTFLLKYSYKTGNTTWEMKEELRLEFNEADEEER
jgi:hypothetical protein